MKSRSFRALLTSAVALALFLVPQAEAATPVPPQVQNLIDSTQAKPKYFHSNFGLMVKDVETGEILLSQNPDRLFTTGSIMKTFTASAFLKRLGRNSRFTTPVFRRGKLSRGTLRGHLVMVGSGDFTFGLRDQPNDTLGFNSTPEVDHSYADTGLPGPTLLKGSNPLRAFNQIARQVRASGIKRIRGNVVVDNRLFRNFTGWPDGDIGPVWINENLLDLQAHPTRVGQRARVVLRPRTSNYTLVNRTRTGPAGSTSSLSLEPPRRGRVIISGRIPVDGGPLLINEQIRNPAAIARIALIDALRRNGVRVSARAAGPNPRRLLPGNRVLRKGRRVAAFRSRPMSQLVRVALKVSANRGTGLLACMMGVKRGSTNCEDGLISILENNKALGVPDGTTYPFDGAGSDDMDRTSPRAALALLENVQKTAEGEAIYNALPILGVDGTFRATGLDSPAKGMIRAKSGNRVGLIIEGVGLVGAQTRMGYMTTVDGRNLVYADLINNVPIATGIDIFGIATDMTAIETAIQQGY